ncbi:MAG: flagellar biosynthetic protein FliR [Polymorphobacter sp.]
MIVELPAFDGLAVMTRFTIAGVRPLVMLALLPAFAGAVLPWRARLAVAAALSVFTAFGPAAPVLTLAMLPGEVLAGLLAGLAVGLAFAAAQMAGEVAAQIIGLGFASFASAGGSVSVIGGLFSLLLWCAFLGGDGHLLLFAAVVSGQQVLPPGAVSFDLVATYGAVMFAGGLRMALPVVAILLMGNLLVAVATRSAPQLGAMSVGPAALLLAFVWALPLLFDALLGRAGVTLDAAWGLL